MKKAQTVSKLLFVIVGLALLSCCAEVYAEETDEHFLSTWRNRREELSCEIIQKWFQGTSGKDLRSQILVLAETEQNIMMVRPNMIAPSKSFLNNVSKTDIESIPATIFLNWMNQRGVSINPRKHFEGKEFEIWMD